MPNKEVLLGTAAGIVAIISLFTAALTLNTGQTTHNHTSLNTAGYTRAVPL